MKYSLLFLLLTSLSISDEITLKSGITIRDVTITEIDNQQVHYLDSGGIVRRVLLRDVNTIYHPTRNAPGTPDRIYLRNGTVMEGTIGDLDAEQVTIFTNSGDTATYTASEVQRIAGNRFAFSFHSSDDKYFFLTRPTVHFIGGKPSRSLEESQYRFIFSLLYSIPTSSYRYVYPDILDGKAQSGYGLSFTLDNRISPENALSFSYRFTENAISSSDSINGSFSEWSSHFLSLGVKRYFTFPEPFRVYAEGKFGYVYCQPPENVQLSSEQSGGFMWSVGGGIYFTDNVSFDIFYLSGAPDFAMTRSFLTTQNVIRNQRVSVILAGFSYTFGSYN